MVDFGKLREGVAGAIGTAKAQGRKDDVIAARFGAAMAGNGYISVRSKEGQQGDYHVQTFQPAKPGGRFEKVEVKVKRSAPSVYGIKLPVGTRIEVQLIAFPTAGGLAKIGWGGNKHVFQLDPNLVSDDLQPSKDLEVQVMQRLKETGIVG